MNSFEKPSDVNSLELLPLELLIQILFNLRPKDLVSLSRVSLCFYDLYHDWRFWSEKANRDFGFPLEVFIDSDFFNLADNPCERYQRVRNYLKYFPSDFLVYAARKGYLELVQYLSKFKVGLNTALYFAAAHDKLDVMKILVNAGASEYNEALTSAAREGQSGAIEYLVLIGATNLDEALIEAIHASKLSAVQTLIQIGATNLNHALVIAAQWGRFDMVKYLVGVGASNINGALNEVKTNLIELRVRLMMGSDDTNAQELAEFGQVIEYLESITPENNHISET